MTEQQLIAALSMDLKRVALGLHRGSHNVADRFIEEALKREDELAKLNTREYIKKLLRDMKKSLTTRSSRTAEDALMYSTLFQNFVVKNS